MHAAAMSSTMESRGYIAMSPGVTTAVACGLSLHVFELQFTSILKKTGILYRHFSSLNRLFVVVDASKGAKGTEGMSAGENSSEPVPDEMKSLSHEQEQQHLVDSVGIILDNFEHPSEFKVLVVCTKTPKRVTQEQAKEQFRDLFSNVSTRVKELCFASIGMTDDVSVLSESLAWLKKT